MTFQDKKGFIWICSENGIVKFNGKDVITFTIRDGLPTNDIWHMNEDDYGRLWLGGFFSGLYYIENDSVKKLNQSNEVKNALFINQIKDTLFFSTYNNKTYYYCNGNLAPNTITINNQLYQIHNSIAGNFKAYSSYGANNYIESLTLKNSKGKKIDVTGISLLHAYMNFDKSFFKKGNELSEVYLTNNDSLKKVNIHHHLKGKVTQLITIRPTSQVFTVVNDTVKVYKNLWTGERNYLLEKKLSQFKNIIINSITMDDEKNIWVTKYRGNIIFIPHHNDLINRYRFNVASENHFLNLTLFNDKIYFNSLTGNLFSFDIRKKAIKKITETSFNDDGSKILYLNKYKNHLYFSDVMNIKAIDTNENIHNILTMDNQFAIPFQFLFKDDETLIFSDLEIGKLSDKKLTSKRQILQKTNLIYKTKNQLIRGAVDGLHLVNIQTKQEKHYPLNNVLCLKEYKNKYLIGTNGDGLVLLDTNGKKLFQTHKEFTIYDLAIKDSLVFLATNKGIYIEKMINEKPKTIKVITIHNGLTSNNVKSIVLNKDGIIYAGTDNGLNEVHYKGFLTRESARPKIYLNYVSINDSLVSDNKNSFNYNQNSISFSLTGISYYSLGNIAFSYKLKGLDDKWKTSYSNLIQYNFLPPGDYTFLAKSISVNGEESTKTIEYPFTINKHYTQQWWFLALIILSFVLLAIFIMIYFQRRRLNKLKVEKRFAEIEMKALQSQMNPHFIFNSLNAIQSVMFLKGEKEANSYIGDFSKLIRMTLDNSKASFITLDNEVEYLTSYIELEKRRLKGNLDYTITIDKKINRSELEIPCMLFQPLVENAIIHGLIPKKENRKLTIHFYIENKALVGEVTDNGIGRKNAKKPNHKSWATKILTEKVEVLNRTSKEKVTVEIIDLEEESSTGTKISIILPLVNLQ